MRCVKCKRVLFNPAKVVATKDGPEGWGRVCAAKAGLLGPPVVKACRGINLFTRRTKKPANEDQLTLDFAV